MMTPNVDIILNFAHLEMGIDDDVNAIYFLCAASFFFLLLLFSAFGRPYTQERQLILLASSMTVTVLIMVMGKNETTC